MALGRPSARTWPPKHRDQPGGDRYAATLAYLEEQGAVEPYWRTGNAVGEPKYVLGERGLKLHEEV